MADLQASGSNPGTQYLPVPGPPPPSPPYNEDRQVTLTGGLGTQMYRTVNAQYDASLEIWTPISSASAYAEVQNPDGSMHYYVLNSSGTWNGSDNNAVFNGIDFGMVPNDSSVDSGVALQKALDAVVTAGGGTIFIPSGEYTIMTGISKDALTSGGVGIIIEGTGAGAELDFTNSSGGTLFAFSHFSITGNGVRLRNLRLVNMSSATTATAVSLSVCQNITCQEIFFDNWPTAFNTDAQSGQCGLLDCTIEYDSGPNGAKMVTLAGSEDFVRGCVIREGIMSPPSNCYGISITSSNGFFIDDVHISDFDYGLLVSDMARDSVISNLYVEANVCAVQVQPTNELANINNICFSNCVFGQTKAGGSGAAGNSGVIVTTNGGSNTNIAGILFNNCIAYGWGCAGIEIDQGQGIVISGGQFASNGQKSTNANLTAGIAIAGGTRIVISGADCSGINEYWQEKGASATTQPTGIAITNNASPVSDVTISGCNLQVNTSAVIVAQSGTDTIETVLIRGCDASNYILLSSVLVVTGTPTNLQMTDCAGYNDRGLVLTPTIPGAPPSGTFQNTSTWTHAPAGWFGPIAFYVWNGTGHVTIDTVPTGLTSGGFTLSPGETASIASGGSPKFLAVGK